MHARFPFPIQSLVLAALDRCSEKQKAELQPYLDMDGEELSALYGKTKSELDALQAAWAMRAIWSTRVTTLCHGDGF